MMILNINFKERFGKQVRIRNDTRVSISKHLFEIGYSSNLKIHSLIFRIQSFEKL